MRHRHLALVLGLSLVATTACQTAAPAPAATTERHETLELLNATLWIQQAAEARALTLQAYALARLQLDAGLADASWTAAAEQGEGAGKPPAVILDVDETVLDNSFYEARAIHAGVAYAPDTWAAWCEEATAPALAGALEFCTYAQEQGATVFYVTNRRDAQKEATRRNLQAAGFPFTEGVETLVCRTDESDKGPRRAAIAADYRIVLLIGDAATDFSSEFVEQDNAQRIDVATAHAADWGTRWIVLPNPMYGDWEANLRAGDGDAVAQKLSALRRSPSDPFSGAKLDQARER